MGNTMCVDKAHGRMRRTSSYASSVAWSDMSYTIPRTDTVDSAWFAGQPMEASAAEDDCNASAGARFESTQHELKVRQRGFEVGSLPLSTHFDPSIPQVRSTLLRALGLSQSSNVTAYKGCFAEDTDRTVWFNAGNMNQGIWFVSDGDQEFVLKLVKCAPQSTVTPSETDVFERLFREFPELVDDLSVAFPVQIFHVVGPAGTRQHDLHVMRRIPGRTFNTIIESYWKNGRRQELMNVFRKIGEFLRDFHARYHYKQHCDVGPQNIFYDEVTQKVAVVDLGMMGTRLAKDDVEAFSDYISTLKASYGADILQGIRHFKEGYHATSWPKPQFGGA